MNRAEKGWETRYKNEIAILVEKIDTMREELYADFLHFLGKITKYQDLAREYDRMQKELEHFQRKHKGGPSSE
jgi:uncharacterized coiled-coil DUF342 family protein